MGIDSAAYVIGHISILDEAKWAEYRNRVPATLEPWGAELLLRASKAKVLGGEHRHSDVVVIRFPDLAAADGWFNSPAYQALIPLRTTAAEVDLISFAG